MYIYPQYIMVISNYLMATKADIEITNRTAGQIENAKSELECITNLI